MGDYLRSLAPNAIIRNGDYPREKTALQVTVIVSALSDVEKVREYYQKATKLVPEHKKRAEAADVKLREIDEAAKDVPSLLS